MDYYLNHLEGVHPHLPDSVRYLAVDGYYAKEQFVLGAVALKLDVISKLRRDANLRYVYIGAQKPRGRRRKYDGKVDLANPTRFEWVCEVQPGLELLTAVVWHYSFKCKVRLAYLKDCRNLNKPSYALLFSTDLDQPALDIYRLHAIIKCQDHFRVATVTKTDLQKSEHTFLAHKCESGGNQSLYRQSNNCQQN